MVSLKFHVFLYLHICTNDRFRYARIGKLNVPTKRPERLLMLYKRLGFIEYPFIDTTIYLFSLCVLFSHFRPRDALMGIFLCFFALVMRTFAGAKDDI